MDFNSLVSFGGVTFITTAGVAPRATAEVAAMQRQAATAAAIAGAIAIAVEEPGDACQATWLAAIAARAGEAAAPVAGIAAVGWIADPLTPIDVAATLAAGGLVVEPSLDAAAAADGLTASAAVIGVAVGHPLFIGSAEERASLAVRPAAAAAPIRATTAASEKGGSANQKCPPGNHREVL